MAIITSASGVWSVSAGDTTVDYAAMINAALADPTIHTIKLEAGEYLLHSPIYIPSAKSVLGAGRDVTVLRAALDFSRPNPGEADGVVNTEFGAANVTLSDFMVDGSKLMPGGFRLVGVFMHEATDFNIDRVDVYNITGYGHFAQGDANSFTAYASGTYDDCAVYNAQIAFEQMAADGITLTNIFAGDGDGDLVGTYFHPLTGSRNITYINATAIGYANVGFELTANVKPLDNIVIINSSVTMLGNGAAFVAAGGVTTGLVIEGSTFIANNNSAGLLYGVQGTATNSTFQGSRIAVVGQPAPDGTVSNFTAINSVAIGIANVTQGGAAFGVGGSGIHWDGGVIEARAFAEAMIPLGSSGITFSAETRLIAEGYDAGLRYTRNAGEMVLAPNLDAHAESLGSFSGGSLTVTLIAQGEGTDRLSILHQGLGSGQIGFDGTNVTFGGTIVGTVSGGLGRTPLTVSFQSDASAAAVDALVRVLTYANTATGAQLGRDVQVLLRSGSGQTAELNLVVLLSLNQAPFLDSAGGSKLTYTENDAGAALLPLANVIDLDSPDFAGGILKIGFAQGGEASDRLEVISQGNGPGQIELVGDEIRYEGLLIATLSGGTSGSTPLIASFNLNATPTAVQALVRAVAYANVSDAPSTAPRMLSVTLTDGDGAVGAAAHTMVSVVAVDDPAVLQDDAASTAENRVVSFSVLANDSDPDATLRVIAIDGIALAPNSSVALPSGAIITLTGDGTLTYNPNAKFSTMTVAGFGATNTSAIERFSYRTSDGLEAWVTITIHGVRSPEDELRGSNGDDMIVGSSIADRVVVDQGGSDAVNAAEGDDVIIMGPALTIGDRIDGGAGFDKVIITGNYNILLRTATLINVEQLDLSPGGYSYIVASNDDTVAAGSRLTVNGQGLGLADTMSFDGSAERDGVFLLMGGSGSDSLTGGALADELRGGSGDDALSGGAGADLIYGGTGNDRLLGGLDNDVLYGQEGNDTLIGQDGDDSIDGGVGVDTLYGGQGTDYLLGGLDNDVLYGQEGNDTVIGQDGDDNLDGGAGADTLYGGQGRDYLVGGLDNDVLYGQEGNDTLLGHDGDDTLDGGGGVDTLYGGAGKDYLLGGLDNDVLYGQEGNDTLLGQDGDDTLDGGAGVDTLYGGAGKDYLLGGLDNDALYGQDGNDTLLGQDGDDTLDGGAGTDALYGGAGADYLLGGADGDRLLGESGNDNLLGHDGEDSLDGGDGDDALYGGLGADSLIGGTGSDRLYGETGNDSLLGGDGDDMLDGGEGEDILRGGTGNDFLTGGVSNDRLYGDAGHDRLFGDAGNDLLEGGDGNDSLFGSDGDDALIGGLGVDILEGGLGRDRFIFQSGADTPRATPDWILDFQVGIDKIDVSQIDANTLVAGNDVFAYIGSSKFTGQAGQLRISSVNGNWRVEGDTNGDGIADLSIEVTSLGSQPLNHSDFFL